MCLLSLFRKLNWQYVALSIIGVLVRVRVRVGGGLRACGSNRRGFLMAATTASSAMQWVRWACVSLGLSLWLVAGCSSDTPPAASGPQACKLNSDCGGALVCSFGYCHAACVTSKDCTKGERCTPGYETDGGLLGSTCLPIQHCSLNSDCPEPLVCGVDLQCRAQCKVAERDCASGSGQLCVSGVCADSNELVDGKLPLPDGATLPATGGSAGTGGAAATSVGGGTTTTSAGASSIGGASTDTIGGSSAAAGASGTNVGGSTGTGGIAATSTSGGAAAGGTTSTASGGITAVTGGSKSTTGGASGVTGGVSSTGTTVVSTGGKTGTGGSSSAGICVPGKTKCADSGTGVLTCTDQAQWPTTAVACPSQTHTCSLGVCVPCATGTLNCNDSAADSCEVYLNLTTSCGTTCANAASCPGEIPTCNAGTCGTEVSPTGCAGTITPGNVTISTATDLTAFANAPKPCISGDLIINSTSLTNLTGLEQLQWVGGSVSIYNNATLTNLAGLSGLTTVGANFNIQSNNALSDLTGVLPALTTIGGYLQFYGNPALLNIKGFASLAKVGTYVYLYGNSSLAKIGRASCRERVCQYV